jgi:hypothetical protein
MNTRLPVDSGASDYAFILDQTQHQLDWVPKVAAAIAALGYTPKIVEQYTPAGSNSTEYWHYAVLFQELPPIGVTTAPAYGVSESYYNLRSDPAMLVRATLDNYIQSSFVAAGGNVADWYAVVRPAMEAAYRKAADKSYIPYTLKWDSTPEFARDFGTRSAPPDAGPSGYNSAGQSSIAAPPIQQAGTNVAPAAGGTAIVANPTGTVQPTASSLPAQETSLPGTLAATTQATMSTLEREMRDAGLRNGIDVDHPVFTDLYHWAWLLERTASYNGAMVGPNELFPGDTVAQNKAYTFQEWMTAYNAYVSRGNVIMQAATVVNNQLPSGFMDLLKMLYDLLGRILAGKR